ncbi:hypothetical protein LTR10_012415 [Elasticomyces elasticus]|nr:hypothetical protein LTR10_012415 [Elasticomyces elasticus]KAK4965890.1 hypothetical protein LTR42_011904 [Elasticomyces elasticus]
MAQDYTEWLAINVLNDQQLVNYRSLSRALKVHSNLAKQMLFDFHRKQNAKKPGTVHATYLITGTKRKAIPTPITNDTQSQEDGEDAVMQSSPVLPSSSAAKPEEEDARSTLVQTVILVKEEHLEKAQVTFESITGMHIYSLQANGLGDIQALTECNRKIAVDYASEDPLEIWKQYGTIQNPNVKRRTQRRQPPPPTLAPAKDAAPKAKLVSTTSKPAALKKEGSKDSQDSKPASKPTSAKATPEPSKKPPMNKRQGSDIFKSFAKGKTKAQAAQESQESAVSTPKAALEDEQMGGFSDEDETDEVEAAVVEDSTVVNGKSKKDREAELQAMMEQEDEVMEDAAGNSPEIAEPDADEGAIDKPDSQAADEPNETVQVENGRRRGRRRVMRKKTVKDEDGYLVTKEEAAWESFSEDEPAPKKIKVPPTTSMNKPAAAAAGKKSAKPGQGNIMSFFGKK